MSEFRNKFSPIIGVLVFIIAMVIFILLGAPIQMALGMGGVAITELMILMIAILAPIILKQDLRLVFPIRIPKLREIFGTLLIWIGTLLTAGIVSMVCMYFFPEGMTRVSDALNKTITSVPFIFTFLIVAVMPAICEEALHRGFILANFKPIKNKFIIVLSMGIIFGIFHTDVYRFLPTAILGGALSYVMLETDNMILPMIFHFTNNLLSSVASTTTDSIDVNVDPYSASTLLSIGALLIFGFIIPFLYYFGSRLLKGNTNGRIVKRKHLMVVFVTALTLLILGIFIMGEVAMNNPDILNTMYN